MVEMSRRDRVKDLDHYTTTKGPLQQHLRVAKRFRKVIKSVSGQYPQGPDTGEIEYNTLQKAM